MEIIINDTIHLQILGYSYNKSLNQDDEILVNVSLLLNGTDLVTYSQYIGLEVTSCKFIKDDTIIIMPAMFKFKNLQLNIDNMSNITVTLSGN